MTILTPPNEMERLAALHRYAMLDTPSELAFDRITRLAARIFEVPVALINFVDADWHWTKSSTRATLPEPVPRELSFCAHTILDEAVYVVPDALADPHFAGNPFVTARMGLRFYAGAPVRTPDGYNVGTLCVVDTAPRSPSADQLAALLDLAALVADELLLHQRAPERRATTAELATEVPKLIHSESAMQARSDWEPQVLQAMGQGLTITDALGCFEYVNPAFAQMIGYTPEGLVGQNAYKLVVEKDQYILHQAHHNSKESIRKHEVRLKHANGSLVYVLITTVPRRIGNQIVGMIAVSTDLTERRWAEQALRASEARYRTLTEAATDAIYTVGHDGLLTSLNPAFERITGWSRTDWIGRHFSQILHPNDLPFAQELRKGLMEGQTTPVFELPLLCSNGQYVICEFTAAPQIQSGNVVGILGIARDVTARKQAQAALHESNARLQAIVNSEPECVTIISADGSITEMNPAGLAMVEADEAKQVVGRMFADLVLAEDRPAFQQLHRAVSQGEGGSLQFRVLGLRGGIHWVETSQVPLRDQTGAISAVLGVTRDITERKAAEAALNDAYSRLTTLSGQLRRGRDLLRTLFDGLDDGLLLTDTHGHVLAANQALATLLGTTPMELVNHPWNEQEAGTNRSFPGKVVRQTLFDGRPRRRRERYTTPDGRHCILDLQTLPLIGPEQTVDQVILHVADVTERVQMEALVMQNERLAANGKLAATMAHEINTPLQSIRSCLYLAGKTVDIHRDTYLELAREEIDRISGILQHLLDLHRPGTGTPVPIDINALLERVLLLTGGTLADRRIETIRSFTPDLPMLTGRPDQLTQVLLNLTINAVDAMPHGGQLCLSTATLKAPSSGTPTTLMVAIADTGSGMNTEVQTRIFEPFFTTKSEGSGIGLAISQKIVAQHGGRIEVASTLGEGSTFTLVFPLNETHSSECEAS